MRELQRECESAEARLQAAKAQERPSAGAVHGVASDRGGEAGHA